MRRLKLVLAYDGTDFSGFQRQKNALSVQEAVEKALSSLCREEIKVAGSGRTDAGVHAYHQVVSFSLKGGIPTDRLVRALNSWLPESIRALAVEEREADFHARISACWKRYTYKISLPEQEAPFSRKYNWVIKRPLDFAAMEKAAAYIVGKHDFAGFQSSGSVDVSAVKTIYQSYWEEFPPRVEDGPLAEKTLRYTIEGDGFVYHMVRNLVWAMVEVGLGRKTPEELKEELTMSRGSFDSCPAPAEGLYLDYVGYEPYEDKL